jgi:hypothetical protein
MLMSDAALVASDGRPKFYDAQVASWQPCERTAESSLWHLALDASPFVAVVAESALNALEIPHHVCWLSQCVAVMQE